MNVDERLSSFKLVIFNTVFNIMRKHHSSLFVFSLITLVGGGRSVANSVREEIRHGVFNL